MGSDIILLNIKYVKITMNKILKLFIACRLIILGDTKVMTLCGSATTSFLN